MDICLNFIKLHSYQKPSQFKEIRKQYLKSFFIFDCIAVIPGLFVNEGSVTNTVNLAKLARFVHYNRFFEQINLLTYKVMIEFLKLTRQKVNEVVDLLKLILSVILLAHIMACIWIILGRIDEDSWVNQYMIGKSPGVEDITDELIYGEATNIYTNAFYFILTTITTVGYGDITG